MYNMVCMGTVNISNNICVMYNKRNRCLKVLESQKLGSWTLQNSDLDIDVAVVM